jgi:hypothetical protein
LLGGSGFSKFGTGGRDVWVIGHAAGVASSGSKTFSSASLSILPKTKTRFLVGSGALLDVTPGSDCRVWSCEGTLVD